MSTKNTGRDLNAKSRVVKSALFDFCELDGYYVYLNGSLLNSNVPGSHTQKASGAVGRWVAAHYRNTARSALDASDPGLQPMLQDHQPSDHLHPMPELNA